MVSRVTRPVRRHVSDYVGAFKNFTDNAQVYLYSIFLQSLGGSMVGTVFALYIKSAGMRESTIGYVEGAIGIATALVALVGPLLVTAVGYRVVMLAAFALLVASRFAQALLPVATGLIALGLVVGLGDGFLRTVNSAFLAENSHDHERTHLFSTEFLVRMLAVFIGAVVGGVLPSFVGGANVDGFHWTLMIAAGIMALGLIPMALVKEETKPVEGFWSTIVETTREFCAWEHLVRIVTPQAFLVAAGAMTAPFVPLYLRNTLHASVGQIGFIQGFAALAVGVAAFATPTIAKRLGVGRGVTILQLAALPLLLAVPYVGGLLYGVIVLYLRSTLMGMGAPLYNEFSMEGVKAQDKPFVGGGLFFVLSVMGFIGNVVGGRLMEHSYTAPYVPAAGLYAVGTVLTFVMWVYLPGRKMAAAEARENAMELA